MFIPAFTTNAMTSDFLLSISPGWVVMFLDCHPMVFTFLSLLDLLGVALAFRISILNLFKLLPNYWHRVTYITSSEKYMESSTGHTITFYLNLFSGKVRIPLTGLTTPVEWLSFCNKSFWWRFLCCHIAFWIFWRCRGFCHRTESDIFLFLFIAAISNWHIICIVLLVHANLGTALHTISVYFILIHNASW